MIECVGCKKRTYSPYSNRVICADCNNKAKYTLSCAFCRKPKTLFPFDGFYVCVDCFEKKYFNCSRCGRKALDYFGYTDKYNSYCTQCYNRHYARCYQCNIIFNRAHVRGFRGAQYCTDCIPNNGWGLKSNSFNYIKSKRWYGIEIECRYVEYTPDDIWKEKDEHCGVEFISPLLQGDDGLATIEQFYYDTEPEFNEHCGLHVHVDVRDFTDQQLLDLIKALKDTQYVWFDYVDISRHGNEFCEKDIPEPYLCDDWYTYVNREYFYRYAWVNLSSIWEHGSVEFRLHEATDDPHKVIKWVEMIVNFVSEVKEMSNV